MKLYHSFGMNPRTIRMFLAEKGIELELVEVDLFGGENRRAPFVEKNPAGQTPLLELDDGTYISETVAICEFLESLYPENPLIGSSEKERALTRMWWRRVELNICIPMVHAFYYKEGYDLFKDRVHCIPTAADELKTKAQKSIEWLESQLPEGKYIASGSFTVADICLFTYVDLLRSAGQPINQEFKKFGDWFNTVSQRQSAEASLWPEQPMGMRG